MKVFVAQDEASRKSLFKSLPSIPRQGFLMLAGLNVSESCTSSSRRTSSPGFNNKLTLPGEDKDSKAALSIFFGECCEPSGRKSGCFVVSSMRLNHRPCGSTRRPACPVIAWMGRKTNRSCTFPTVTPEYPANAPCTAFCAKVAQYWLSKAFAGVERIMYVGSMYLIVFVMPNSFNRLAIAPFSHKPASAKTLLPPASTAPELLMSVSPHPSATTMTQCFFVRIKCAVCSRTFSESMFISGRRQMSTCLDASVACIAMKPQCLPISFTKPMQFALHVASTYAESTAFKASVQAVSKPKV
mmetsp:Transcript_139270/g.347177  ORF Transcript_139270/g.347177 Transcript_139270/m.347177 type:complete len:299 (+) Transcript_139270:1617-2513(+)